MEKIKNLGIIQSIEEVIDIKFPDNEDYWEEFSGYKIITNQTELYLVIRSEQQCCEHFGYLISEDDFSKFIGTRLNRVKVTDKNRQSVEYEIKGRDSEYQAIFIDLNTDHGTLQFTAYNSHNGYYGHNVIVRTDKVLLEQRL